MTRTMSSWVTSPQHANITWREITNQTFYLFCGGVMDVVDWTHSVSTVCLLFLVCCYCCFFFSYLQVHQTVSHPSAVHRLLWYGWVGWSSWWSLSGSTSGCAMWPKWCRCQSRIHLHPFLCTCHLDEWSTAQFRQDLKVVCIVICTRMIHCGWFVNYNTIITGL